MRRPGRLVVAHGLAAVAMAMPWPALLVAVWATTGSELWLGVVGAARMAPYVVLSWLAGVLGDRVPRMRLLRVVTALRALLLVVVAVLLSTDLVAAAVVLATVVVAVGTPAYPALAAAMPQLAGRRCDAVTSWLVTVEVGAFVVGPAVGGLLLGVLGAGATVWLAAAVAAAASTVLLGLPTTSRPRSTAPAAEAGRARSLVLLPGVVPAIAAVVVVNAVLAAAALVLLPMTALAWDAGDGAYGATTAALGFGALGAPLLHRVVRGIRTALVLIVVAVTAVAVSPVAGVALLPLVLVGAATTQVECEATAVIQRAVPDTARAFALGVTDTAMVSAAMVGAAVAPWLAAVVGPRAVLALLAIGAAALLPVLRARRERPPPVTRTEVVPVGGR